VPSQIRSAVVDLFAEGDDVVDLVTCHEGQGRFPDCGNVVSVLDALQPERHLAQRDPGQVLRPEQLARCEAAGEMVERRPTHQRVVDVKKGGGSQVGDHR